MPASAFIPGCVGQAFPFELKGKSWGFWCWLVYLPLKQVLPFVAILRDK